MTDPTDSAVFPRAGLPQFAEGQKLLLAAARLQAHGFRAAMRFQIEMLNFMRHRCEQDMKLVDDLIDGEDFNDAFDVFVAFMQNASSEYTVEAGKVASLGSKFASETARRLREQAGEAAEDRAAATAGG